MKNIKFLIDNVKNDNINNENVNNENVNNENVNNENVKNLIDNVNNLPDEIIRLIKDFFPKKKLVFTNRENYKLYHSLIWIKNTKYDHYIQDAIRRDNEFVFEQIIQENYKRWIENKNYRYKNILYKNYLYFIIEYCIENESSNCRKKITYFLKELGLCKNLHKKNISKYIR